MKKLPCALLILLCCCVPFTALAVSYTIDRYQMTVEIQNDGSADITETLLYDFDGEYNGILSAIDIRDVDGLEGLSLYVDDDILLKQVDEMDYEPFTYTLDIDDGMVEIQAYAPGNDDERVFRYEYRLSGLCQRYLDAAHLNYKLIGTANQVALRDATIRIALPGEVYNVWAHGAAGDKDLHWDDDALIVGPIDVPSGQFVETNILFDEASLSSAPVIPTHIIEDTREMEADLKREYASRMRTLELFRIGLIALLGAYIVIGAFVLRSGGRTVGYNKKNPEPNPDIAVLKPVHAAVAQFIQSGRVDVDGLTGTLLELVQANAVQMHKPQTEEEGVYFELRTGDLPALADHQRYALEWLFAESDILTFDRLDAQGDAKRAQAIDKHLQYYGKLATEEAGARGYLSGKSRFLSHRISLLVLVGIALSVGLFALSVWWAGAVAALATLVVIVFPARLRPLSDTGEQINAALLAVSQHQLAGQLTADTAWLLPLIAAIGELEPYFEQYDDPWPLVEPWMYVGWYHDVHHTQNRLHSVQKQNRRLLESSSSSGGSSSSSGGGGGGGGHGAW